MVGQKISNKKKVCNTSNDDKICLSNRYSPLSSLETKDNAIETFKDSAIHESKTNYTKKKVNKRLSEYMPTWMSSPKEAKSHSRCKGPVKRNPIDINDLELSTMRKIKASPHLSGALLSNINSHIDYLEKRHVGVESKSKDNVYCTNDLKLKGGAKPLKMKIFNSVHADLNTALNLLRSTNVLAQFMNHQKCLQSENCCFCLLRSCLFKINTQKGRNSIVPVEIEVQKLENCATPIAVCQSIVQNAAKSLKEFEIALKTKWSCSICSEELHDEGYFIELQSCENERNIMNLIDDKLKKLHMCHKKHESGIEMS